MKINAYELIISHAANQTALLFSESFIQVHLLNYPKN